jgi:hypothetical protein
MIHLSSARVASAPTVGPLRTGHYFYEKKSFPPLGPQGALSRQTSMAAPTRVCWVTRWTIQCQLPGAGCVRDAGRTCIYLFPSSVLALLKDGTASHTMVSTSPAHGAVTVPRMWDLLAD